MSASIKFVTIENLGKDLEVWTPSSFIDALTKAFGVFPCELGPRDKPILHGLASAMDARSSEAIARLIEEIGEDRRIKVWAEY